MRQATTSETVLKWQKYFKHYGIPRKILSYTSSTFISSKSQEFLQDNNIIHILTFTYHRQSNSVGRYNREVVRILRVCCNKEHTKRNKYLHQIVYFLNNTVSEYHQATSQEIFLNFLCYDFVTHVLSSLQDTELFDSQIRTKVLNMQFKRNR